jgi:hypothetical protein
MARKLSKASVSYRPAAAFPLPVGKRCGSCSMIRRNGGASCTLVAGKISPVYVCDRWAAK